MEVLQHPPLRLWSWLRRSRQAAVIVRTQTPDGLLGGASLPIVKVVSVRRMERPLHQLQVQAVDLSVVQHTLRLRHQTVYHLRDRSTPHPSDTNAEDDGDDDDDDLCFLSVVISSMWYRLGQDLPHSAATHTHTHPTHTPN